MGDAGLAWLKQLPKLESPALLLKALGYRNGRPIAQQAVYIAPPFDRRKERFKTLSAEVITQAGETFDPGLLTSFVSRLKQG